VFEKRRQKPAANITIFIDGRIQRYPTIFPVPDRVIRTTSEERDTKWRSANNHQLSLLFCLWQTFSIVSNYTANSVPTAKKRLITVLQLKTGKFCS